MKKILLIASLSILNINSTQYHIALDNSNYKDSINVEVYTSPTNETPTLSCTLPLVSNDAGDTCIDTFDKVGWIDRTDSCQGVRQMVSNNNLFILKSNSATRNDNPIIPEGYRWIKAEEYLVSGSRPYNYYSQCGHAQYPKIGALEQREITFSDSNIDNKKTHAGTAEGDIGENWNYPNGWLGIVVIKEF